MVIPPYTKQPAGPLARSGRCQRKRL